MWEFYFTYIHYSRYSTFHNYPLPLTICNLHLVTIQLSLKYELCKAISNRVSAEKIYISIHFTLIQHSDHAHHKDTQKKTALVSAFEYGPSVSIAHFVSQPKNIVER